MKLIKFLWKIKVHVLCFAGFSLFLFLMERSIKILSHAESSIESGKRSIEIWKDYPLAQFIKDLYVYVFICRDICWILIAVFLIFVLSDLIMCIQSKKKEKW
jgi:hypothetical protein